MSKQYDDLSNFIQNQMRMSHIYQPVMLIELLSRQGSASTIEIAKALLGHDISQVDYYAHITKNMVGKVLTKSRGITSKEKDKYSLNGFDDLNDDEIEELINLCNLKISEFLNKRGDKEIGRAHV